MTFTPIAHTLATAHLSYAYKHQQRTLMAYDTLSMAPLGRIVCYTSLVAQVPRQTAKRGDIQLHIPRDRQQQMACPSLYRVPMRQGVAVATNA